MIQNNHQFSPQYAERHHVSSCLPLLAPGVAQQIVAQPDDVLLHDGELGPQATGLDERPTESVLEQEADERGVSDLGEKLFRESNPLPLILKKLEQAGYITRIRDPADERQ